MSETPITRQELRAELRAERAQVALTVQEAVRDAVGPLADQLESQLRGDFTEAQERALDERTRTWFETRDEKGWNRTAARVLPVLSLLVSVVAAGAAVAMAAGYL